MFATRQRFLDELARTGLDNSLVILLVPYDLAPLDQRDAINDSLANLAQLVPEQIVAWRVGLIEYAVLTTLSVPDFAAWWQCVARDERIRAGVAKVGTDAMETLSVLELGINEESLADRDARLFGLRNKWVRRMAVDAAP